MKLSMGMGGLEPVSCEETEDDHAGFRLVVLCASHEHGGECLHLHAEVRTRNFLDDGLLIEFLHSRQERDDGKLAILRVEDPLRLWPRRRHVVLEMDGTAIRAYTALVVSFAIDPVRIHQRFATLAFLGLALLNQCNKR